MTDALDKQTKISTYNQEAARYDEGRTATWGGLFWYYAKPRIILSEIRSHFKKRRDIAILDMCAGTGRFTLPLARLYANITAADLSEGMLAINKDRAENERLHHVVYDVQDIETLTYPPQTFDAIICVRALLHVPDPEKAIFELVRVLKPGGRLLFTIPTSGLRYAIGQLRNPSQETTHRLSHPQLLDIISRAHGSLFKRVGLFWVFNLGDYSISERLIPWLYYIERFADKILPANWASETLCVVTKRWTGESDIFHEC